MQTLRHMLSQTHRSKDKRTFTNLELASEKLISFRNIYSQKLINTNHGLEPHRIDDLSIYTLREILPESIS